MRICTIRVYDLSVTPILSAYVSRQAILNPIMKLKFAAQWKGLVDPYSSYSNVYNSPQQCYDSSKCTSASFFYLLEQTQTLSAFEDEFNKSSRYTRDQQILCLMAVRLVVSCRSSSLAYEVKQVWFSQLFFPFSPILDLMCSPSQEHSKHLFAIYGWLGSKIKYGRNERAVHRLLMRSSKSGSFSFLYHA